MAETSGRENRAVADRLFKQAGDFGFFQAVRLLEWIAWEAESNGNPARRPVGEDFRPEEEVVRFRVPATFGFASAEIASLKGAPPSHKEPLRQPLEMNVAFLGLIGPSGELPQHFTSEAITRSHGKDHALREFFDIFQHRSISLFYRAWRKYRFRFELERQKRETAGRSGAEPDEDTFSLALRCVVGLGTAGLARRMAIADETASYFSGHFARLPRCAVALEQMLEDYFELPADVIQFSGRWLTLPTDQRTSMPSQEMRLGRHCELGRQTIVGSRVWDVQTRFRVRLGPMTCKQFMEFVPGGPAMRKLADLSRLYVGPALEFEVQPVIRRDEVPTARLVAGKTGGSMLTRNAWLASRPRTKDADEAVFSERQ